MQSVEHCDKKKVDCKVSSACASSSTSVPPSTSKATIANHTTAAAAAASSSQSANEKNTMSATEIKLKNKFCNTNTSPIKTVIEKYKNKIQPCDSSESDEESVSEVCYQIRHFRKRKEKKNLYIHEVYSFFSHSAHTKKKLLNLFLFSVVVRQLFILLSLAHTLSHAHCRHI